MGIENYSVIAADNDDPAPDGWPEGMAASDVNNSARQNMADTRTQWNDAEWFEFRDGTPDGVVTFVANNQFKIVSPTSADVTGHWHIGRRVQILNAGTFFATITATSFSVDTTTVTIDSTPLTNTALTAFASVISFVNSPLPEDQTIDTLTIGTAILIGGTGAANTFNDYEEGTFTPLVEGTTVAGVANVSSSGRYTKIGRALTIEIQANWASHTGSGNMIITGLPFTNGAQNDPVYIRNRNTSIPTNSVPQGWIASGATLITMETFVADGTVNTPVPKTLQAAGDFYITAVYSV